MFGGLMMLVVVVVVVMMMMGMVMHRLVTGILREGRACEQQHRDRRHIDFAHNTNPRSCRLNYVAPRAGAAHGL